MDEAFPSSGLDSVTDVWVNGVHLTPDPDGTFRMTVNADGSFVVEDEKPLTTSQAARRLGLHRNTLRRMDDPPYYTVNERGDRRYRPSDLADFMRRRSVGQLR